MSLSSGRRNAVMVVCIDSGNVVINGRSTDLAGGVG